MKEKLDLIMEKIKENNPDANWANLLTGIGILVLIAIASIWYFGKVPPENVTENMGESSEESRVESSGENGEETSAFVSEENVVVVDAGEGLWQIAERVCGDGEQYIYIAEDNGLSMWAELNAGQELVVNCK